MIKIENVVREPNVVELKPWKSIHDTIKEPMVTGLGPMETDSALAMGFARITEPDILGYPPHKHPFDQWVYLIGDTNNFADFDADVANPNTDTTVDDFRQDLEIKVTKVSMGAQTKK